MLQGTNLSSHDAGPIRTIIVGTGGTEDEEPAPALAGCSICES